MSASEPSPASGPAAVVRLGVWADDPTVVEALVDALHWIVGVDGGDARRAATLQERVDRTRAAAGAALAHRRGREGALVEAEAAVDAARARWQAAEAHLRRIEARLTEVDGARRAAVLARGEAAVTLARAGRIPWFLLPPAGRSRVAAILAALVGWAWAGVVRRVEEARGALRAASERVQGTDAPLREAREEATAADAEAHAAMHALSTARRARDAASAAATAGRLDAASAARHHAEARADLVGWARARVAHARVELLAGRAALAGRPAGAGPAEILPPGVALVGPGADLVDGWVVVGETEPSGGRVVGRLSSAQVAALHAEALAGSPGAGVAEVAAVLARAARVVGWTVGPPSEVSGDGGAG